jgi:hypothetical protein
VTPSTGEADGTTTRLRRSETACQIPKHLAQPRGLGFGISGWVAGSVDKSITLWPNLKSRNTEYSQVPVQFVIGITSSSAAAMVPPLPGQPLASRRGHASGQEASRSIVRADGTYRQALRPEASAYLPRSSRGIEPVRDMPHSDAIFLPAFYPCLFSSTGVRHPLVLSRPALRYAGATQDGDRVEARPTGTAVRYSPQTGLTHG